MSKDTLNSIKEAIKKVAPNRTITNIYDGGNRYLVVAASNNMDENSIDCDPYYGVVKDSFNVVPVLPMAQMEWFLEAKKHPIEF